MHKNMLALIIPQFTLKKTRRRQFSHQMRRHRHFLTTHYFAGNMALSVMEFTAIASADDSCPFGRDFSFGKLFMSKPLGYFDLKDALAESGCPVCRLEARAADSAIDTLLWESVNDVSTRHRLNAARGFCRTHAEKMLRHGAALGVSIIMRDVIHTVADILAAGTFQSSPGLAVRQKLPGFNHTGNPATAALAEALSPQTECPICTAQHAAGTRYLQTLVTFFTGTEALAADYRRSDGLCLPHFQRALGFVTDAETFNALAKAQLHLWRQLTDQLDEFIRKNDYRFQHEKMGREGDAWQRALAAIAGGTKWT